MTRAALILALCLATPASAATVQLDPGDAGVIWTAEGFRPADGLDLYSSKYTCPRVGRAWKDTATDRVMRDVRCDEPLSGGGARWASPSRPFENARKTRTHHLPSVAAYINTGAALADRRFGYALPNAPHSHVALDPHPHIPPVPLPASVWLLALALGLLWRVKA